MPSSRILCGETVPPRPTFTLVLPVVSLNGYLGCSDGRREASSVLALQATWKEARVSAWI